MWKHGFAMPRGRADGRDPDPRLPPQIWAGLAISLLSLGAASAGLVVLLINVAEELVAWRQCVLDTVSEPLSIEDVDYSSSYRNSRAGPHVCNVSGSSLLVSGRGARAPAPRRP